MSEVIWDRSNEQSVTKHPQDKVVHFCFRKHPPEERRQGRAFDNGRVRGVYAAFLAPGTSREGRFEQNEWLVTLEN